MKVLHVCRGMANSSGTTHIVKNLTEELARLGVETDVFHVAKPRGNPVLPDNSLVHSREYPMTLPFNNPGISFPYALDIHERVEDYDLVHIHAVWNFPTWMTMRAAWRRGVPYVVAPQGSMESRALSIHRSRKAIYTRCVEGPWLKRASALQALTPMEARQMRRFGAGAPIAVIPNGVRLEDFGQGDGDAFKRKHGIPTDRRILLFLSRVHPKKGLDLLADTWGRIKAELPDVDLIIAGDDGGTGYREEAESLFSQLPRVKFIGEVRETGKLDAFAAADAFILPSWTEGLPVAVLEAMASSLPVVITKCCNIPEVKNAGAGFVVDTTAQSLSEAVLDVLRSNGQSGQMGYAARELVARRFTWRKIASRTLALYDRILGGSPA